MKKLLNKNGSVLFLVVAVMSLLIIAVSATYYIVSNQHSSAQVHYSSEQSYQTAYFVSKAVNDYLTQIHTQISSDPSAYNGSIFEKMMNNDALTADKDLSEYGLGDFEITINKTKTDPIDPNGNTSGYFDITVTAHTNGETVSLTQVWKITLSQPETTYFKGFLTCTGEESLEDSYITARQVYGDVFFGNEFTKAASPVNLNGSLYASGTFEDEGINFEVPSQSDMVIGENLYMSSADGDKLNLNRLFVGGDLYDISKGISANAAYILGDLNYNCDTGEPAVYFIKGDCTLTHTLGGSGAIAYIEGDLYLSGDGYNGEVFYVKGNVYDNSASGNATVVYGGSREGTGNLSFEENSNVSAVIETAMREKSEETQDDDPATKDVFSSWYDVADFISSAAAKNTYQVWDAEKYFEEHYPDAPTIFLDNTDQEFIQQVNGGYIATIKQSCRIVPAIQDGRSNFCIIFDATDNDLYVYLDSHGYQVNGRNCFSFFPGSFADNVYVKGKHAVIFILPDGTDFKTDPHQFIGHFDLARKISGSNSFNGLGMDLTTEEINENQAYGSISGEDIFVTEVKTKTDSNGNTVTYTQTYLNPDPAVFGEGNTIHNNIFIVAKGRDNNWDFNSSCTFAGYIYAPYTILRMESGGIGMPRFFGGLMAGSCTYANDSGLAAFCPPYDPYTDIESRKGGNIVSYLINQAGGVSAPEPSQGGEKNVDITPLGYR